MESYTISSVPKYLEILKELDDIFIYRGHGNQNWNLIPSIGRAYYPDIVKTYEDWEAFEDDLIMRFRKYAVQFMDNNQKTDLEWLIIAQHHGMPTRLLDWSLNPLKALFFAVINEIELDGCIWLLQANIWVEEKLNLEELTSTTILYPQQINSRLIAQEGCFTVHSYPSDFSFDTHLPLQPLIDRKDQKLVKVIVPAHFKKDLRLELDLLGINYRSLFPDLDGLTTQIKWELDHT